MSGRGAQGERVRSAEEPLERESELAEIRRTIAHAREGRGALLAIEGPSGIGKSRLLASAVALARRDDMELLLARAGELEGEYPFGVVLRLFEAQLHRADADEQRRLLRGRAMLAAPLLDAGSVDARPPATGDEFALIHGLYWCLVNLAERGPTVLLVDDVQWADDLSLRFLNYAAQRLDDLPVALLFAIRTGDPGAESALATRLAMQSQRSLRPVELSLDAVRQMLAASEVPAVRQEEFVQASWETTGGNPFLVSELLATIRQEPDRWSRADPTSVQTFAPQSVGRNVILRLESLGPDAIAFARACAILGDAPLTSVGRLSGLDLGDAAAAAERLTKAQVLAAVDPPTFAHPMFRSAVYGEIAPETRPRAHATAARLLHDEGAGPDEVARHLVVGVPIDDAWALGALHDGAKAAARKGAPGTAVRYLRRALGLSPTAQRDAAMLMDLGMFEAAAGDKMSIARFEEAMTMITDPSERARALYALGQTLYRYGRHSEAAATFKRGAELFGEDDEELGRMFTGAHVCAAWFTASMRDEAYTWLEASAAEFADRPPRTASDRVLMAALAMRRAALRPPAPPHAALGLAALGDGALVREQSSEGLAANLAIIALVWCGHAADAERALDCVLEDARRRGAAPAFAEASFVRALVMRARGRVTEAMADAQAAIDVSERGWSSMEPAPQAILADCLIERGELDAAAEAVDAAERVRASAESRVMNSWLFYVRGRLRLLRADPHGALEDFLSAGELIEAHGMLNPAAPLGIWRAPAGLAAHAAGDAALAGRLIDEEITLARRYAVRAQLGGALRIRAATEDDAVALKTLEQAIAALEDADAPLELARALADLGRLRRRAGQRVACREPLRRALDLAHRCGALALERFTHDELLASGARPRSAVLSGLEALTPSERRIAELAANGLTNREIAETLFLTRNTVQWHLRHIYRKLGADCRAALSAQLAAVSRDGGSN